MIISMIMFNEKEARMLVQTASKVSWWGTVPSSIGQDIHQTQVLKQGASRFTEKLEWPHPTGFKSTNLTNIIKMGNAT